MVTMSGGTWLYTKPAMQVPIVLPCFCGGVHLFFCATISPSSCLLLLVVVEGVVVAFDEASVGLMAHGWVYEGMGLVSGERRLVWQCGVLCCVVHPLCVWSPLFGTHHPLCLHTSHSYQPPLDGVVRWRESTTVPLSISLFAVRESV